jgi:hypothetical protein
LTHRIFKKLLISTRIVPALSTVTPGRVCQALAPSAVVDLRSSIFLFRNPFRQPWRAGGLGSAKSVETVNLFKKLLERLLTV